MINNLLINVFAAVSTGGAVGVITVSGTEKPEAGV